MIISLRRKLRIRENIQIDKHGTLREPWGEQSGGQMRHRADFMEEKATMLIYSE